MNKIKVFHTGFSIIKDPDLNIGRTNADFSQGFYLSDDEEFSKRWARFRKDKDTYINIYELLLDELNIKYFNRDEDWFKYILNNRRSHVDYLNEYDLIIGPIANDTIYETWGIFSSGLLKDDELLDLLSVGPCYKQIAVKSLRAKHNLKWLNSEKISEDEIIKYRSIIKDEQDLYLEELSKKIEEYDSLK